MPQARPVHSAGVPYYGEELQRLVETVKARIKQASASHEYETIRQAFDLPYFLIRNPDIAQAAEVDPIQHYIDYGADEGRDPSPDFSTRHYVERYPDVKESGMNPFYHWLKIGCAEGRIALTPMPWSRPSSARQRTRPK